MIKFVLIASLLGGPAHGLESVVEGSVEISSEATSAALVPANSFEISVTLVSITAIAATIYAWDRVATQRAYTRAADEARVLLSQNNLRPISSSEPGSELRRAADVEIERLRLKGHDPAQLGEVELARLVIAHADAFITTP